MPEEIIEETTEKANSKQKTKQENSSNANLVKLNAIRKVGIGRGDVLGEFAATQEEINNDKRLQGAIQSGYVIKI